MPLPLGLSTVTVTGTYLHADGTAMRGKLVFLPEPAILTSATHGVLVLGAIEATVDANGLVTATLLATDDPDVTPVGWTYRVTERWYDAPARSYPLSLPSAAPTVDLADVTPTAPAEGEYTVITGPAGPAGAAGPQGEVGPQGATGATGPQGTAGPVATAWRRRDLPDLVLTDSLYAGTAPVISTAQTSTPTSGYLKFAPAGVALTGSDTTGSFRYAGAGGFHIGASGADLLYVKPTSRYPNTYSSGQSVWSVEFGTDTSIFQLKFQHQTVAMYRLTIDGRRVTDLMQAVGGTTAGSGHLMTINLGSAAPRRIRFDFYTVPFGGIYLPPTATMWDVPLDGGRLMVLGDSLTDGSSQNTGAGAGTWLYRTGRHLGSADMWEQGRGGTGYITAGSYATFANRAAADVIAWAPDRLIIWGGYNDSAGSQSAIGTAADALYAQLEAGLPACQMYVIGCWSPSGSPGASLTNTDATLKTAAAAAGIPFISPISGSVYDAAGALVATHGPWITTANTASYIGGDAIHPNDAGHNYLARRITAALRELMPA